MNAKEIAEIVITENLTSFIIEVPDGWFYRQEKAGTSATDAPLTLKSEVVLLLCKRIQALLAKQEGMVPVEQVCPVCAGGPVIVLAECRDCATEFVSPEMSRYNKTVIAKAKE